MTVAGHPVTVAGTSFPGLVVLACGAAGGDDRVTGQGSGASQGIISYYLKKFCVFPVDVNIEWAGAVCQVWDMRWAWGRGKEGWAEAPSRPQIQRPESLTFRPMRFSLLAAF